MGPGYFSAHTSYMTRIFQELCLCWVEGHVCAYALEIRRFLLAALKFKAPHYHHHHHFYPTCALPDVTWAESLSERTFHGNELRVIVCPGAQKVCLEHREKKHLGNLDLTAPSTGPALQHWKAFIKAVRVCEHVCVSEENMWCFILGIDTWIPSEVDLRTLVYKVHNWPETHACVHLWTLRCYVNPPCQTITIVSY